MLFGDQSPTTCSLEKKDWSAEGTVKMTPQKNFVLPVKRPKIIASGGSPKATHALAQYVAPGLDVDTEGTHFWGRIRRGEMRTAAAAAAAAATRFSVSRGAT